MMPPRCDGVDLSLCPELPFGRDPWGDLGGRCDDYDGRERAACAAVGIDPDDTDARFGARYEDVRDTAWARLGARPVCAATAGGAR